MRREPRTFVKIARALTDAEPEFVSLVTAGANKTPFMAVRLDASGEGEETMQVRQRTRHAAAALDPQPTHPLQESVVKADGYEIAAIEFTKGEAFADEEAVKGWLDAGGYTDYEIETVDGGWSVRNKSVEFEGALRTVSSGKGFDVMVGKAACKDKSKDADPDKDADGDGDGKKEKAKDEPAGDVNAVHPVAKSDALSEQVKKFDGWYAQYYAEGGQYADAIMAGMYDGLPPGMYELTQALYGTIASCVQAGDLAGVTKAANDYASVVVKFVEALQALDASEDAGEASQKAEGGPKRVKRADVIAAVLRSPVEKTEENAPEGTAKAEGGDAVSELKPVELKSFDFGSVIKEAMAPVAGLIETLTKTVSDLNEKVEKVEKSADTRIKEIETRVSAPARKGADVGDVSAAPASPRRKTDSDFLSELATRSAIGATSRRP